MGELYERGPDGKWYMNVKGSVTDVPDGSITTAMFAPDAKAPSAATADSVTWDGVTDKPAVIAAGVDQAAARAAIGAGTSSLSAMTAAEATTGTATTARAITAAVLVGAINERTKGKAEIAALTPLADTSTATLPDVATLLNDVIAALKA